VPATTDERVALAPTSIGAVVRDAGPRLLRDGFGPLAVFFTGWKLIDLTAGVALAALFGVSVFAHERRRGRPAMVVRLALILVAIRATVGFSSGSATVYLAQEIGIDTLLAGAVFALLISGRPFAGYFAADIFPLPEEMRDSDTFREAMRSITIVWGTYFLARALVRLVALLTLSTDRFALVIALSDAPFLVAILAWSVYHTAGAFRNSARWAPIIQAVENPSASPLSPQG
jgi:intracellular septation protein A